jgi:hypothetical protein
VHSFRPSQRLSVIQFDIKRIVIRVTTQINEEVLRRAPGAGELLQADVFSKGVVSLVATIIADYYGNARCVASGRAASETSALFDWLQASPSGRSVSLPRPFWPSASPSQPSRMSASESLVELALSARSGPWVARLSVRNQKERASRHRWLRQHYRTADDIRRHKSAEWKASSAAKWRVAFSLRRDR